MVNIKTSVSHGLIAHGCHVETGKDQWMKDWFNPTLDVIRIDQISWESLIDLISHSDPDFGAQLTGFYAKCLESTGPCHKGRHWALDVSGNHPVIDCLI